MSINILMPALSPTMTEGKLAKWHVKVGDSVKSGQVICEIETDKATMEVEAVDEGKIGQIVVPEGAEGVAVNAVIADPAGGGRDGGTCRRCACCGAEARGGTCANGGSQAGRCCACCCSLGTGRTCSCGAGTCRTSASRETGGGAERRPRLRLAARQAHRRGEGARSFPASRAAVRTAASSRPTSSPPSPARRRPPLPLRRRRPRPRRRPADSRSSWRRATQRVPAHRHPQGDRAAHARVQADRAAFLPDGGPRDRRAAGGAPGDQCGGREEGHQGLGQRHGDQGLRQGAARSSRSATPRGPRTR